MLRRCLSVWSRLTGRSGRVWDSTRAVAVGVEACEPRRELLPARSRWYSSSSSTACRVRSGQVCVCVCEGGQITWRTREGGQRPDQVAPLSIAIGPNQIQIPTHRVGWIQIQTQIHLVGWIQIQCTHPMRRSLKGTNSQAGSAPSAPSPPHLAAGWYQDIRMGGQGSPRQLRLKRWGEGETAG